ncbi:MAG: helix-turn-helix transcriptional regulator [Clostridium sp.]
MKSERLRLCYSQKSLSNIIGTTESAINNYERNTCEPSKDILKKLLNIVDKNFIISNDEYIEFLLSDYVSKLKKWRSENNLSLRAAARILGVDQSSYQSWESSTYNISRKTYYKIRDKLNEIIKGRD